MTAQPLKRRHVAAVTLGNALEFYDFLTYAFFAIQIGRAFFPATSAYGSLMLSLATFGAGFITRPIGAIVIGAYADRVGRKPAMLLCFVLIGASILTMAVIPSYERIGVAAPILVVLARMVQGFSLGGEIGSSTAYLAEAASPERRGFVVALQGMSQQVATLAASAIGIALTAVLAKDQLDAYGWRIALAIGGAAVPVGLWLRHSLPETLHAGVPVVTHATPSPAPSRLALARQHRRLLVIGLVVIGGGTIASYVQIYVVTYAQATLHMSERAGFLAQGAANIAQIVGALVGGHLSDRRGRRPIMIASNLGRLLLVLPLFWWVVQTRSPAALIIATTALGLLHSFTFGAFYAAFSESLPRGIRSSAFGTVYSASVATFGGTTQLVVTWLIHATGSALAPAWYVLVAAAAAQVALFALPESAPRIAGDQNV